ncbi:MAG: hypothetical protein II695_04370, partial [Oscillospiraceae bacterium]|nr:hypothetical protein [Oscillospiraceae bacterium]
KHESDRATNDTDLLVCISDIAVGRTDIQCCYKTIYKHESDRATNDTELLVCISDIAVGCADYLTYREKYGTMSQTDKLGGKK